MDETDKQEFAALVAAAVETVLDDRDRLDHETHSDHHAWIQSQIQKEEERRERRDYVRQVVTGALAVTGVGIVISLLGWIGTLVLSATQNGNYPGN